MGKQGWEKSYEYVVGVQDFNACDSEHAWVISKGSVYTWNGAGWEKRFTPESSEYPVWIEALDPSHVWLTTSGTRIVEKTGGERGYDCFYNLYLFDGTGWTWQREIDSGVGLMAVDAEHAWSFSGSKVYFFDGTEWSEQFDAGSEIVLMRAVGPALAFIATESYAPVTYTNARGNKVSRQIKGSHVYGLEGSSWIDLGVLDYSVEKLEALDGHHVWAMGQRKKFSDEGDDEVDDHAVFFYDGTSWEKQLETEKPCESLMVWSAELAWARSEDMLYVFDGDGWELQLEDVAISDLEVADDQNAWLVKRVKEGPEELTGRLMCFDGSSWSETGIETPPYGKVYVLDASHVWALAKADNGNGTVIRFYNGAGWADQFETPGNINQLVIAGPDRVWACSGDTVYTAARRP